MLKTTTSVAAAAIALLAACNDSSVAGPVPRADPNGCIGEDGTPLPVQPRARRVDLEPPSFSDPTRVTNPLFPISDLHAAVLLGRSAGIPLRIETTLLPARRTLSINGEPVAVNVSQFLSLLDGRILEIALDHYGQDDAGNVWYFGEDVFNYADGVVVDTEGTWLAGRDGPPAMIMPAHPRLDDVYRPENLCGLVFEEVTVKGIDVTVAGPRGPVAGAVVVEELHADGTSEDKTFAPGYGEFLSGSGDDVEALALAVPTDALTGPVPAALTTVYDGALRIFDAAARRDWRDASRTLAVMSDAWNRHLAGDIAPLLKAQQSDALDRLSKAVASRTGARARQAALATARAALDLRLQHQPPTTIDIARFDLWAAQLVVDAAAKDSAAVRSDAAILAWTWDRFVHVCDEPTRRLVGARLGELDTAVENEELARAMRAAADLRIIMSRL